MCQVLCNMWVLGKLLLFYFFFFTIVMYAFNGALGIPTFNLIFYPLQRGTNGIISAISKIFFTRKKNLILHYKWIPFQIL
jgi:hypothetical protein